jgi:hypothetical protein
LGVPGTRPSGAGAVSFLDVLTRSVVDAVYG